MKAGIDYDAFAVEINHRIDTNDIRIVKSPLKFRELILIGRIFFVKSFTKNQIKADRNIVELMVNEIFVKRGTSDSFQDKLYAFLDECKVKKDEEEFTYLVGILRNKL